MHNTYKIVYFNVQKTRTASNLVQVTSVLVNVPHSHRTMMLVLVQASVPQCILMIQPHVSTHVQTVRTHYHTLVKYGVVRHVLD